MRLDSDGAPIAPDRRAVLVPGGKRDASATNSTPGAARKQFDRLIERLKGQRQEIASWQAFKHAYHQQLTERYEPLARRLRDKRIAMAELLDRALDGRALTRREDLEARATVSRLLEGLLAESEDADLVALHDKYAEVSFAEDKRARLEALRHCAREDFGVDVDAYEGPESPEDFTDWLEDQAGTERSAASRPELKDGEQSGARLASQAALAEGGRHAVREVFRKLVSELHPDRETDPIEQARKTAIMQRVNQAYKAGDLLTLLELQFVGAPVESGVLAGVAKQRLRRYVQVLEAQSRKLRDELAAIIAPFTAASGSARARKITPDVVQRALDADVRKLKQVLRDVELDLIRFRDIAILKQSLRSYR